MAIYYGEREEPLISFIITDYNISSEILRECVDSIMSLNMRDDEREIILIDDGSEVTPVDVVNHYGRLITYFRQPNKGLSGARNAGMALAKGKYLQFVDGDDCIIAEVYDKIIEKIKSGACEDMLMFDESRTDKHGDASADICFHHTMAREFLMKHNLKASACGYVFRRSILGELTFKDGIFHEDELFTSLLMCRVGSMAYTNSEAYYYRQREDSITTATTDRHREKRLRDFFSIIVYLHNLTHEAEYGVLTRRVNQLCMDYIYRVTTLFRDYSILKKEIERMKKARLYPIAVRRYTMKYFIFSIITRTEVGLRLFYELVIKR